MLLSTMPKIGEKAPAFSALDQDGITVRSSDLLGRKVALYFYPEDDSPTCNQQACGLRDDHLALMKAGFEIIGVSPDDQASHKAFHQKFRLPFRLLADPEKKVIHAYGVWGRKQLYGRTYEGLHRTTFLIDEQGRIARVITGVRTKIHAQQILGSGGKTRKKLKSESRRGSGKGSSHR